MGRDEENLRKRKAAAKKCKTLTDFGITVQKKVKSETEKQESDTNHESSSSSETSSESDLEENEDEFNFPPKFDIGTLCSYAKDPTEVTRNIDKLSDSEKFEILTQKPRPSENFVFPKTENRKALRSFKRNWFFKFLWIGYSLLLDGVFCIPCMFFATFRESRG